MLTSLKNIALCFILLLQVNSCKVTRQVHVMVVAGGHDFDTTEFVEMFQSFEGITFDTIMQPRANQMIASGAADTYDVIVFYDMWRELEDGEKQGYLKLTEEGKGLVFLHHSLVSYQSWQDFRDIIGGRYFEDSGITDSSLLSTYKHDILIPMEVIATDHPVMNGITDFSIHDEGYGNIQVNKNVDVLLKAVHPDCYPVVGWTHSFENSKIVYLMMGHDRHAYRDAHFQQLLQNAIHFVR